MENEQTARIKELEKAQHELQERMIRNQEEMQNQIKEIATMISKLTKEKGVTVDNPL